jgi:hypothetical protein
VRKLSALLFSAALLIISIAALLLSASTHTTPANAAPYPIEIISISELSSTSVEILFNSTVSKRSLSYFVINAATDSSVGKPKNIKKVIKTKANGLIATVIKNLNSKEIYNFSVSAKTNKGKMINSEVVEYSSLSNLMDVLSNLPADWGNPKPIQLPAIAPTSAPAVPIVISTPAIAGVTAPITGATPVTTTTAGTGYTGTVSWSGSPATFAPVTTYTATITLTPTSAYTLTGVAANLFTVAGATSNTNSANSGVITAVFPVTAVGPPSNIAISRASVGTARRTAFTTQPQITIRDSSNNTVTSSSAVVTATVSTGGTLVGTTTATASSGVATFSGLGVDGTIGATYTITYTAEGLNVATATVVAGGTTCNGSFTCQVGDTGPGGGKIFYYLAAGFNCGPDFTSTGSPTGGKCKWLEGASLDWTDQDYNWSGNTSTSVTTETTLGSGYKNTRAIVTQSNTAGKAGTVSRAYSGGGLTDWFLPSKDELGEIQTQRSLLGISSGYYWSSSQSGATEVHARNLAFNTGNTGASPKTQTLRVRPIRAF